MRAAPSGSEARRATSSCLVARSWSAGGVARAGHKVTRSADAAWADTEVGVGSTSTAACAAKAVAHRYSCAGHAAKVRLPRPENWTAAYDMTLEGREVSAFELRPSCRKLLGSSC
jgi:hypothetical protein